MDSGLRKNIILKKLPLSLHRAISCSELKQRLEAEDDKLNVSLRTIQRDLKELSEFFPLLCTEGEKPPRWYIESDAAISAANLDATTAITWLLACEHLKHLLPASMQESLQPYRDSATKYLARQQNNPISQWHSKIAVHSRGLALAPAQIENTVVEEVYSAVLYEQRLKLSYQGLTATKASEFIFHPYAVVVRGERSYLIGTYDKYQDLRQLALCRILHAEKELKPARIARNFDLQHFIASGNLDILRGQSLALQLKLSPMLARLLEETPLSDRQMIFYEAQDIILQAEVENSEELRQWLLSHSTQIEVLAPADLREEIKQSLQKALNCYLSAN